MNNIQMNSSIDFDFSKLAIVPHPFICPSRNSFDKILLFGDERMVSDAENKFVANRTCSVIRVIPDEMFSSTSNLTNAVPFAEAKQKLSEVPLIVAAENELRAIDTVKGKFETIFIYRESLPDIGENVALLEDTLSKEVITQQQYMLDHNIYIKGFSSEAGYQHNHKVVFTEEGENILSIGPYYGNLLKSFSESAKNRFVCHCFEANPFVYAQLCLNIVRWGLHGNVVPVCAGIWSSSGMVAFSSDGHTGGGNVVDLRSGTAPENADMAIYAYSVDDYVRQNDFVPTLIESGRIGIADAVIAGAAETIQRLKPKLILLDYPHSKVPALVKRLVPEYRVFYSESDRIRYGTFFFTI